MAALTNRSYFVRCLTFRRRIGVEAARPSLLRPVEGAGVGLADAPDVGLDVGVVGEGPADRAAVRHEGVGRHAVGDA